MLDAYYYYFVVSGDRNKNGSSKIGASETNEYR